MYTRTTISFAAACLASGLLLPAAAAQAAPEQDYRYRVIHHYGPVAQGRTPSELTAGGDGFFYGTTFSGGSGSCTNGCGTLFRVDTAGTVEVLHSFTGGNDGDGPIGGVSRGSDGTLYGTTSSGGTFRMGTVFRYKNGVYKKLHDFSLLPNGVGSNPVAAPVQGPDGALYGTTLHGGSPAAGTCESPIGCGTLYRMTTKGEAATRLHSFSQTNFTGEGPRSRLAVGPDGNLYGTELGGDTTSLGAIFRWSPTTGYSTVHQFAGSMGAGAWSGLTLGPSGHLYGTLIDGGSAGGSGGTIYRLNVATNAVELVYAFPDTVLSNPRSRVAHGPDGTLYGTTASGGSGTACVNGCGGVYAIKDGVLNVLHDFQGGTADGREPRVGVVLDGTGLILGTTEQGGRKDVGTVYRLTPR